MSSFICEKCGCIENTSMDGTNYWTKRNTTPLLCSECYSGKWHDAFEKKHWTEIGTKDAILKLHSKCNGSYVNVEKYFSMVESDGVDPEKEYKLADYIKRSIAHTPKASADVLRFIFNFCYKTGNDEAITKITKLFADGYCYYFANMLKLAFSRGEVVWHYKHDHILWKDDNDICYDIYGVFDDIKRLDMIPVEYMCKGIKGFLHVDDYDILTDEEREECENNAKYWQEWFIRSTSA